jgi:serine/threonine-protein kinase
VASSLAEAHLIGLVHRDLKPANIFLVEVAGQTHAKVLDFGIARILDEEATRLTSTGQVFGTPRYMSPEQALSTGEVDARSDIYSLGLIIFECIVGQPPFVAQTSIQYLSAHSTQTPPKLREQYEEAPEPLERLIDACLAKEASARPQSADEVSVALRAIKRALESGGGMEQIPILSAPPRDITQRPSTLQSGSTRTHIDDKTLIKAPKAETIPPPAKKSNAMLFGAIGLFAVSGAIAAAIKFWPEPEVSLNALDAAVRVAVVKDAALPVELALNAVKDSGAEPEAEAEPDAGTTEETAPPEPHGKRDKRKGKGRSKDRGEHAQGGQIGGPEVATPQGNGVVTGPASMVLDTGGDEKGEILKRAKACKDSEWKGAARLTLKGCPSNCAVIVDEKCAGRTPAKDVALPPGYRNVAVVCGSRIKMNMQAKFTADESADLRCQ